MIKKTIKAIVHKEHLKPVHTSHNPDITTWLETSLKIGAWTYDVEADSLWWSQGVFEIYGLDYSAGVVDDTMSYFTSEGQLILEKCMREAIEEGKSWSEVLKLYPTGKEPIWIRSTGHPAELNGRLILTGSIQDITVQVDQTDFIQSLVEHIPSHVISTDTSGDIVFANSQGILGRTVDLLGTNIVDVFDEPFRENVRNCMVSSKKSELPLVVETERKEPGNEHSLFIYTVVTPVFIRGDFRGYIFISNDMTEKVEQQREFEKQQAVALQNAKLASIGELAAGVGHEINNPLEIISAHIQRLQSQLRQNGLNPKDLSGALQKMENAVVRISEIVGGLRTFSRADDEGLEVIGLNQVVKNTVSFIKELFAKDDVDLELALSASEIFIQANKGKIQQVVLNLLNNAKDAVRESAFKKIKITTRSEGINGVISVEDSGPGISPEIKEEIFKAFFTTKPVNSGTGMGLYISNSIIQRFAGRIDLQKSSFGGANFKICLPMVENQMDGQPLQDNQEKNFDASLKNSARVLLVDDEEGIREILAESLTDYGLRVKTASNGLEALVLLKEYRFDVVLSDIKMPKMDGLTLFTRIRSMDSARRPTLILMTGANESPVSGVADEILLKPFSVADFLKMVELHIQEKLKKAS